MKDNYHWLCRLQDLARERRDLRRRIEELEFQREFGDRSPRTTDHLRDLAIECERVVSELRVREAILQAEVGERTGPRPAEKLGFAAMCELDTAGFPTKMQVWPDSDGCYPDYLVPGPCQIKFAVKEPGKDLRWSERIALSSLDKLELRDDGVYKNARRIFVLEIPSEETGE